MIMSEKLPAFDLIKAPPFPAKFDVTKRVTLNFTDINENSNKFYNIEIQVADPTQVRVFTVYGRLGAPNPAKEVRVCRDVDHAEEVVAKIIKDKTKKGYKEVKLVKADVGSEIGKLKIEQNQIKIESLEKAGIKIEEKEKSSLHPEVQSLVRSLFGSTTQFIEANLDTKKCPLGQLSLDQILKGKDILEQARILTHQPSKDVQALNDLTSEYYSNIPHVLPRIIQADILRLDNDQKIDRCYDILDVFCDAKNIEKVLSVNSGIDSQYLTLNATINYIEPNDPIYNWVEQMVLNTRAKNHSFLGKIKVHRIFNIKRSGEDNYFNETIESFSKECCKQVAPNVLRPFIKERPDLDKTASDLYNRANVLPLWHGTRKANIIGITTRGLLIRPSGVIYTGAAYGNGIYWAINSSKSINYCDIKGSYWACGNNKTAYLFLADVALGNNKIVHKTGFYTKANIKPFHSVFAKAGVGNLINDEIITYTPSGKGQQHFLRYIVEFETLAK